MPLSVVRCLLLREGDVAPLTLIQILRISGRGGNSRLGPVPSYVLCYERLYGRTGCLGLWAYLERQKKFANLMLQTDAGREMPSPSAIIEEGVVNLTNFV